MALRICNVITRMIVGGPQRVSLVVADYYRDRADCEFHLISGTESGAEGDFHDEIERRDIQWHPVPELVRELRPTTDLRALAALVRLFRSLRPDVVHARSAKARLVAPLAARIARVPVVVQTVHGWSFNNEIDARKRLFVQLEKVSRALCDSTIFVSEEDLEEGYRLGIIRRDARDRGRASIIRDPVDLASFVRSSESERAAVRERLGARSSTHVVSLVQRLSEPKTPLVFVEAMKNVASRDPDVAMWIVGDGQLREPTARAVRQAGLEERTKFLGVRSDIAALLSASDVVVHSALREGLPLVVLETLSVGTPLVATAVGGVAEAIRDGVHGLLVPPSDPQALANAVTSAIEDRTGAFRRAENGRVAVASFRAERCLDEQHALYERLLRLRGIEPPTKLGTE